MGAKIFQVTNRTRSLFAEEAVFSLRVNLGLGVTRACISWRTKDPGKIPSKVDKNRKYVLQDRYLFLALKSILAFY
jgi:hypothetical protein